MDAIPVRIGDEVFVVRSSDAAASDLLAGILAAHRYDGHGAEPYYSFDLKAPPTPDDGLTPFLRLFAGRQLISAARDTASLWSAFERALAGHLPARSGLIEVNAHALLSPAGAVLLPITWSAELHELLEVLVHDLGGVLRDRLTLSPDDGAVLVVDHDLDLDHARVEVFRQLLPGHGPPPPEPGRYPLRAWLTQTRAEFESDEHVPGPHSGLARAVSSIVNGIEIGPERCLRAVRSAIDAAETTVADGDDLASQVRELLRG